MSTADAVQREYQWLITVNDGLPNLLTTAAPAGLWEHIQPYWARTPATQKRSIYVTRGTIEDLRPTAQRVRPGYVMKLKLRWPVRATTSPLAETEQQNFDAAIEQLRQRIRGPAGDKSHGGRFLSAGETPGRPPRVLIEFEDPEKTIPDTKDLRATAVYSIDDYEENG